MDIRISNYVNLSKYWFSLATALYYAGTKICLHIFHDKTAATGLPRDKKQLFFSFITHQDFLQTLRKHGVITEDEWNLIYNKDEEVDSSTFDLGLLITLLQAISLPEPINGWLNPDPSDFSVSGFLVKLKLIKDRITKVKSPKNLTKNEYSALWDDLCEVLNGLNFDLKDIYEIHQASSGDEFAFLTRHGTKEYLKAFNRAKILYMEKSLVDLKTAYTRHLENVCTVVSVVKHSKVERIEHTALNLKGPLNDLDRNYDIMRRSKYKHAKRFMIEIENISAQITENESCLDRVISRYNDDAEETDQQLTKHVEKNEAKQMRRSKSMSFKKADVVGWFRNNTIRLPKLSRRHSYSNNNIKDQNFFQDPQLSNDAVDMGHF